MRPCLRLFLLLAFPLLLLSGCKGNSGPLKVIPHPTATPAPNADAIVYVHNGQLWMMKWDGSNAGILVASRKYSFWFPEGSPVGDDVLAWMSRPDGTMDIVRVGLDGRYTVLTDIGDTALPPMENSRLGNSPAYDSKAQRIAYSFNGNIWMIDRDGYNAETLISDGQSYAPVWSPDDKQIAYVNGHSGHYDLWVTEVATHDTWQVTDFQDYSVGQPCWVANGKSIMITRVQQDQSDLVEVLADTDVPLVDADVMTKDHNSASARLNKEGQFLTFASAGPQDPNLPPDAPPPSGTSGLRIPPSNSRRSSAATEAAIPPGFVRACRARWSRCPSPRCRQRVPRL